MTSSRSRRATDPASPQPHGRCHDYVLLQRRWRAAARRSGLIIDTIAVCGDLPVLRVASRNPPRGAAKVHLSAGIHGDEPASAEALLTWVETRAERARMLDLLVFPCLNPWGLIHNKREDELGRDLNRCYHLTGIEPVHSHAASLSGRSFDLALLLHEDYEAHGVYLYETSMRRPAWGGHIIRAMETHLRADPRSRIDGSRARRGIVRRRITPATMPEWPEAFMLHFHHARRTFTIETPSEADLSLRVRAHCAAIDAALDLAEGGFR